MILDLAIFHSDTFMAADFPGTLCFSCPSYSVQTFQSAWPVETAVQVHVW